MRSLVLLVSFLSFAACKQNAPLPIQRPAPHYLPISQLKFPLLDEENGKQLFPKTFNEPFLRNNILRRIAIETPFYFKDAPEKIKREYIASGRKISFEKWLQMRRFSFTDTNYYDGNGKLVSYYHQPLLSAFPAWFYDSTGLVNHLYIHGDVIAEYQYNYLYLAGYRTLLQYEIEDRIETYGLLSHLKMFPRASFSFDSSGKLASMIQRNLDGGFCHYTFKYNEGVIDSVLMYFAMNKEDHNEYPSINHSRYDKSVAKYFYNGSRLDSIATWFDFSKNKTYQLSQTTIYDSNGLATATVYRNDTGEFGRVKTEYLYVREFHKNIKRIPSYPGYYSQNNVHIKSNLIKLVLPTIITTSHTTTD